MANDPVRSAMVNDVSDIKEKQADLERQQRSLQRQARRQKKALQEMNGTAHIKQLKKVRSRLNRISAVPGVGAAAQSVRLAELEEAVEKGLGPAKDQLPDGLYRRLWLAVREIRSRFAVHAIDGYALRQLGYAENMVASAIKAIRPA